MWRSLLLFYLIIFKRLKTIARLIDFAFRRYKDKIFLVDPQTQERISFKQLHENAQKILTYLQKKGIAPQEVMAFYSTNYQRYFEVRTAAHLGNYIFFALSPGLDSDAVFYFLRESKTKIFFYDDFSIDGLAGDVINPVNMTSDLFKAVLDSKIAYNPVKQRPSDIATYNLSSGTTKRIPKIVPLTNRNWVCSFYSYIRNAGARPSKDVVFLSCIPLATAGSTTYLPLIFMGATAIIYPAVGFKEELVFTLIKRYKVSRLYLTPSWFLNFLEYCKQKQDNLSELENILIGTEPIALRHFREAVSFFGPKISVGYGMVEVLPPLTLLSAKEYEKSGNIEEILLGSVGRVLKGVTVKIVDSQRWKLGVNEVGLVAIKSKTRGLTYLNNKEAKDHFVDEWFYSEDYGFFDKKGFLHILGRRGDIVFSGERDYFSREIEERIYQIVCVKRVAVVASDDKIYIFVSLAGKGEHGKAYERIKNFCESELPKDICLQEIIIKSDLPVTALGKLNKKELIEEVS
jgi:fatty-acyl-CoA synthase